MKIRTLILILTLTILSCGCRTHRQFYVCGMGRNIVIDPEFDLTNFDSYIDKDNGKYLPIIQCDTQKVYSPDYKFYFEYQKFKDPAHRKVILYNNNRKPIARLKHLPKGETLIWLKNCVILDGGSAPITKKTTINLTTGKVKNYRTKGWFMFLGQTNEKAFFASHSDNNKISGKTLKNTHSIISLNEKGVDLFVDNKSISNSYPDSVYFYDFFNSKFTIRCLKLENNSDDDQPLRIEFISENKVILTPDSIKFFTAFEDSYFLNGDTYLKINGNEIYRVSENSFEKIFDFREAKISGWIRDFKIEGEYLIFKIQNSGFEFAFMEEPKDSIMSVNRLIVKKHVYGYNSIGIVNLKTKECFYPTIK